MRLFINLLLLCISVHSTANQNLMVVTELSPPNQVLLNNQVTGYSTELVNMIILEAKLNINFENTEQAKQYKIAVQRHDLASQVLVKRGFEVLLTTDIQKSYQLLLARKVDLVVDDANYLASMSEQLAINANALTFVHAIEGLAVAGYLAANINTDEDIIKALQQAFLKVKSTEKYRQLITAH